MTKLLRDAPGVLSVESNAGVTFVSSVPESERAEHYEATKNSYFKQRQAYHRDKKHKEHEQAIKAPKHRQPAKHPGKVEDEF